MDEKALPPWGGWYPSRPGYRYRSGLTPPGGVAESHPPASTGTGLSGEGRHTLVP